MNSDLTIHTMKHCYHSPDFVRRTAEFVPPLDWLETWRIVVVVVVVTVADDAVTSRRSFGDPGSLMHHASAIADWSVERSPAQSANCYCFVRMYVVAGDCPWVGCWFRNSAKTRCHWYRCCCCVAGHPWPEVTSEFALHSILVLKI